MTTSLSRRRRSAEDEPEEDERPTRRSRRSRDEEPEERPTRSRRSRDEEPEDEDRPRRTRRSREAEEDEPPQRSRRSRSSEEDEDRPTRSRSRKSGSRGFDSYSKKRKSSSKFADEFKPEDDKEVIVKFLEEGPFDTFNQHWIDEMPKGERKSFVCHDDEYFDSDECPLCDIGDNPSTFSLFNILDLSNPRKPEVKVWKASVTVADQLARLAESKKTSPLDRPDMYYSVTKVKTSKYKTTWSIQPVKERDLDEDYEIEPFNEEELDEFMGDLFTNREAVQQIDSFEDLDELAESL